MARITLDQLSFRYEGATQDTLKGLDLEIADGEAHALLGASGAQISLRNMTNYSVGKPVTNRTQPWPCETDAKPTEPDQSSPMVKTHSEQSKKTAKDVNCAQLPPSLSQKEKVTIGLRFSRGSPHCGGEG